MVEKILISPLVKIVMENLTSLVTDEIVALWKVDEQLKALSSKLSMIQAVLTDAERKQENFDAVRVWLQQLKEVVYDADDILDDAFYHKVQMSQVRNFLASATKKFSFRSKMLRKIKKLKRRLDEIEKNKNLLPVVLNVDSRVQFENRKGRETSSLVTKWRVFGREEETKELIGLLVSDDVSAKNVSVISIVGMGGIGKTTLAQLVYNDKVVKENFQIKIWVHVSQVFDVKRVTRAIIVCHTSESCSVEELETLQTNLTTILNGKKFLLVLDDVWNEEYGKWESFHHPLTHGAKGSKIIVTTRHEKVHKTVSRIIDPVRLLKLKGLTENDCWSLFKLHAFGQESPDSHPKLKEIGRELVKRCRSLPLAAQALGGVLAFETDESKWRNVLQSEIWDLPETDDGILPVLKLSYNYLPPHLKQCFVYCSLFPKNFTFIKTELIRLWMGEGFILPKGSKRLEDIGLEYFSDLLLMSFFQYSHEAEGRSMYQMHDLIHDLAQSISKGTHFREEGDQLCVNEKARHLSIIGKFVDDHNYLNLKGIHNAKSLRTILLLKGTRPIPHDMVFRLRCLRVLVLNISSSKSNLLDSIGELKHLRYLKLKCSIRKLPESLSSLLLLQTLDVTDCFGLHHLPKHMKNLINLRHLFVGHFYMDFPPGIGSLTSLQTLNRFPVGRKGRSGIEELKDLTNLRGTIEIKELQNVGNVQAAKEANLKNKQYLHDLDLRWSSTDVVERIDDERVLEQLQPHTNVKKLSLCFYGSASFPRWMADSLFSNLLSLELIGCGFCKFLPPVGQLPNLKDLSISGMNKVEQMGNEFCGQGNIKGFPSLKILHVSRMENLEEWYGAMEDGEFPHLCEINIQSCFKLRAFPSGLQNLTSLQRLNILNCPQLSSLPGLPNSLEELSISFCRNLSSLPESLQSLSSLKTLMIERCSQLMNFLEDTMLPKLEDFCIWDCDNLNSLPERLKAFTSLHFLSIHSCHQLASLPNDGLPTALHHLQVSDCPLLIKRCKQGGPDWPKMAHIPRLELEVESATFLYRKAMMMMRDKNRSLRLLING